MKTFKIILFFFITSTSFSQEKLSSSNLNLQIRLSKELVFTEVNESMIVSETPASFLKSFDIALQIPDESMLVKETPLHLRKNYGFINVPVHETMLILTTPNELRK